MAMPMSLWFTADDHHDDDHGYVCCSTCITDYTKWSGVPVSKWQRLHTPAQWMRYPLQSWQISIERRRSLKALQEQVGTKAASKAAKSWRKRKRTPSSTTAAPVPDTLQVPAPASASGSSVLPTSVAPAPASASGSIVLPTSVASQVVSAFSHCEEFLDNLLLQAHACHTYDMQQNDPTPPSSVPRNDLTPATTDAAMASVPLNVVSPLAPLHPITPNPVMPVTTTQLSAADTLQLSQSLAKLEKLREWIATALVEVRSVEKVVRNILRR